MAFVLSARSRARLLGVHPHLVRVVEMAIENTVVDFSVVEGVRTLAKQKEYFRLGKSQTMRSRHLPGTGGLSHAVDLAPWINGTIDWVTPFGWTAVSDAMKRSAHALNIPLEWGGDWRTFVDKPHYQLPWEQYP
jgi:peptidoglycan L-alanyl-D-glutamate endopeptidase CwlK